MLPIDDGNLTIADRLKKFCDSDLGTFIIIVVLPFTIILISYLYYENHYSKRDLNPQIQHNRISTSQPKTDEKITNQVYIIEGEDNMIVVYN